MTRPVNALWIGKQMGPIHAACLRSFLECGHDVVLHAYETVSDAPEGVKLFDARKLMREDEIVRHKNSGSLALASDVYRYRILRADMGIYVDCDVYCLRPLPDADYLFGHEDDKRLGSAVLGFPASSAAVADLVKAADDPFFVPPWGKPAKRAYLKARRLMRIPVTVSRQRWGSIGPDLVTHIVRSHGLQSHALPIDALYPVHYRQTALFEDPGIGMTDLASPRTHAIHLWHNLLPKGAFRLGGILDSLARHASTT